MHKTLLNIDESQAFVDQTFPRQARLTTAFDFKYVLEKKARFHSQMFALHCRESEAQEHVVPRLGLVIGKRFAKKSVVRNLIKRCLREVFRVLKHQLPAKNFVIRLKSNVPNLSRKALKQKVHLEARQLLIMFVDQAC